MGLVALTAHDIGHSAGVVMCGIAVLLGTTAIMSQFTGIVAVGGLFGISASGSCALAALLLCVAVLRGKFDFIEQVCLAMGACLAVFVVAMVLCRPSWSLLMASFVRPPMENVKESVNLGELVLANVGTVLTPWMLFYQASAVIEKGLDVRHLPLMRLDTLIGAILSQVVMTSVLVTFAVQWPGNNVHGRSLDKVQDVSMDEAFMLVLESLLGEHCARLTLAAGLLGSSLLAAIVSSMGVAWSLFELFGGSHSTAIHGSGSMRSPAFLVFFIGSVLCSAIVVGSGSINLFRLNIVINILNGLLMPFVVGCLFYLGFCGRTLPEEYRLRGVHAAFTGTILFICPVLAIVSAAYEMLG